MKQSSYQCRVGYEAAEMGKKSIEDPLDGEPQEQPSTILHHEFQIKGRLKSFRRRRIPCLAIGLLVLGGLVCGVVFLFDALGIRVLPYGRHPGFQGDVTAEELAAHNTPDDCWIAMHGSAYDVTEYAKVHPGGDVIITDLCGEDATEAYDLFHPIKLLETIPHTLVGVLVNHSSGSSNTTGSTSGPSDGASCTDDCHLRNFTLEEVAHYDTPDNCLMVLWNVVYNLTEYAPTHPGGGKIITDLAGTDATDEYEMFHKEDLLFVSAKQYRVGILVGGYNDPPTASPGNRNTTANTTQPTESCEEVQFGLEEVAKHNKPEDCYMVLEGTVYDLTRYAPYHPGTAQVITNLAGTDATEAYRMFHDIELLSDSAQQFCVGTVITEPSSAPSAATGTVTPTVASEPPLSCDERKLTLGEVAQHSTPEDCYMVLEGTVYDLTGYAPYHPGTAQVITNLAGTDATKAYRMFHDTQLLMDSAEQFCIGTLEAEPSSAPTTGSGTETPTSPTQQPLNCEERRFTLEEVAQHDTPEDCLMVLEGTVYNLTKYAPFHPGTAQVITNLAGSDATEAYRLFHDIELLSDSAEQYCVGFTEDEPSPSPTAGSGTQPPTDPPVNCEERLFTLEEVAQHDTPENCYMVLEGTVYDLTQYAPFHPGTAQVITNLAGSDGTEAYRMFHDLELLSDSAEQYCVGVLENEPSPAPTAGSGTQTPTAATEPPVNCEERPLTLEEVAQHNTAEDCYMVLERTVYDLTSYAPFHPGTAEVITNLAGTDATEAYRMFHDTELLMDSAEQYCVGILASEPSLAPTASSGAQEPTAASEPPVSCDERQFTLEEVAQHDTPEDCYMVLEGTVYDLTQYAPFHPGTAEVITNLAGTDATEAYRMFHDIQLLADSAEQFCVGKLLQMPTPAPTENTQAGETTAEERQFTLAEVAQHNTPEDCFIALEGIVFDLTNYAPFHPGTADVITNLAGTDATAAYRVFHDAELLSESAMQYRVGVLAESEHGEHIDMSNTTETLTGGTGGESGSSQNGGCQERQISTDELGQHNSADDLWTAFHGVVYDLTAYAPTHPGKAGPIVNVAGIDGTASYGLFHPEGLLYRQAQQYRVGLLSDVSAPGDAGCGGQGGPTTCTLRRITIDEVAAHGADNWMIIHGKVYDMSLYAPRHPGGSQSVLRWAGGDATNAYDDEHTPCLLQYLVGYEMGVLAAESGEDEVPCPEPSTEPINCPDDESSDD